MRTILPIIGIIKPSSDCVLFFVNGFRFACRLIKKPEIANIMKNLAITPEQARSLPGLFRERIKRTPDKVAYRNYDFAGQEWTDTTWSEMATEVAHWQVAFKKEGLKAGDKVAIMLKNSREWVVFDQAAMGLGLVTVPLYTEDRPENVAYIVHDAGVKLLVVDGRRQWRRLQEVSEKLEGLLRIVSIQTIEAEDKPAEPRLKSLNDWIFGLKGQLLSEEGAPDELATIVYTSGTTGRPKGVMLSHTNILSNAYSAYECGSFNPDEEFLSFLPLSHMLERTTGYYFPMMIGAKVVYARSVAQLGDDLLNQKPTILISVPRIYERVYAKIMDSLEKQSALKRRLFKQAVEIGWHNYQYQQGRVEWRPKLLLWPVLNQLVASKITARLGGRLSYAVCGGAAMPPEIARTFLALGVPVYQGYGLTESSPLICGNRPDDNIPESIGMVPPGIEVKIGDKSELLARGPNIMLGYWNNEKATREAIDSEGWLHTGDQARVDEGGHYYITGRIKDIIVLGNGEKVPPVDMEMAIALDPLIEQVMIIGEARPCLVALVVLSPEEWLKLAADLGVDAENPESLTEKFIEKAVLTRINNQLSAFPGYAQVRRALLALEPWTVDDGLITPTLKMKRPQLMKKYAEEVESLYQR